MRPNLMAMPPFTPTIVSSVLSGNGSKRIITITWNDNSITETEFILQGKTINSIWVDLTTVVVPLDQPNTKGVRSITYNVFRSPYIAYRIVAQNTVGYGSVTVAAQNPMVNAEGQIIAAASPDYPNTFPTLSVRSFTEEISVEPTGYEIFLPGIFK